MRFTTTLDKKIKKFTKKFGISKVASDKSFAFYPQVNGLTYTVYKYKTDVDLINHIRETYEIDITNCFFIFSLLHEIGHCKTWRNFTKEELEEDSILRESLEALAFFSKSKINTAYFNLKTEIVATEWALNYLCENFENCIIFQNKCMKALDHIYKKKSFSY